MIQALYNLTHWPLFRRKQSKEEVIPEDKIEVDEKVGFGLFAKEDRKSCAILDTADRAALLLGKPAQEVYLALVQVNELWTHSESDTVREIYAAGYVEPAKAMWNALIEMWTGFAVVPPGLEGTYVTSELIFPELFKISEASRNLLITQVPWAIYTYDWEEFLAKKATYWYSGVASVGETYQAWRELEIVKDRTQPNIVDVLAKFDSFFGWFSPKTWFVGKFGDDSCETWMNAFSYATISDMTYMLMILFMIRLRRNLSVRWGRYSRASAIYQSLRSALRGYFGVNLDNY